LHRDKVTEPGARLAHAPAPESVPTWGSARKTPYDRVEHQANRFAEALLMPEPWLREYWRQLTGDDAPRDVSEELEGLRENNGFGPEWEPAVAVSKELAPLFRVSNFAMQIRLKRVGLLSVAARQPAMQ
ncbi:MAG: ImmA/IrrE family metallo-endopeptidase, partial [Planctomycetes bacterium]|nr:ImmA/IrrE family metallo-endopeptidase [Planctomycetota bacterium]